jgi:serine/threonine-protein kinase RsbW
MHSQVTLKLSGPMDHLRLVWQTGETLLESVEFDEDPESTRYNILLALQEMVTNVLRHAYRLDEKKPVEVSFRLFEDALEVELVDQGPAFDPLTFAGAALVAAEDESMPTEVGGYGIHIAKVVMDELSYQRRGACNVLAMRKYARVKAAF